MYYGSTLIDTLATEEYAIERADNCTYIYLYCEILCNVGIVKKYLDFKHQDWYKETEITIPKSVHVTKFLHENRIPKKTAIYELLADDEQNDEFIEFLKTL